jgi:3-oxosteroid 1-dehydrogenase
VLADQGPYYATIIVPAALDTKGGPMINPRAEVLRADGTPIPGLYGAGNCVASPAGKSYWAAGATIGPAVTFGYLAGRNAARSATREPATSVPA